MQLLEDLISFLLRIRNAIALPISPGIAMQVSNLLSTTSLSIFKVNNDKIMNKMYVITFSANLIKFDKGMAQIRYLLNKPKQAQMSPNDPKQAQMSPQSGRILNKNLGLQLKFQCVDHLFKFHLNFYYKDANCNL